MIKLKECEDYLCTDESLQNTILLAYCGSLQLPCNRSIQVWHMVNMPFKPKRSNLHCQFLNISFLEKLCIK